MPLPGFLRRWLTRRRRFRSALLFNRQWTFSLHKLGGIWRCPSCGTDHDFTATRQLEGRLFPACCEFPAGSRYERQHATGF